MRKRYSAGPGGGRHRTLLFVTDYEPRHHSFFIPIVVSISVLVFIITMYVNDCPHHGDHCSLSFLGRLSFQPMYDNPLLGPSSQTLVKMGGISSDELARDHQIWRPFTCIWLHAGFIHMLVDLLSLLFIGIRLEQEFGFWRIGSIYFLSGIGGSLLSALFIENRVSVGSSGALFGLIGAIVSELLPNWRLYSKKFETLTALFFIGVLNFIIGIFPHIDNFAHIGGFLFGFFLAFIFLMPPIDWSDSNTLRQPTHLTDLSLISRHKTFQMFFWATAVLVLVIGYLVLMVLAFRGVNANEKCSWCRSFSCVPSSHWSCGGGSTAATCNYVSSPSNLVLTCEANQRTQLYSGFYTASAIRELCAELCSSTP